ncbi:hypothetical protein D9757_008888 [Collybiopsis confluens]|uniref:Zn(2)-C6 fungal-type domain-containing protein n=1 Tax=Collybiopsis confluens TaxID=2823264 RepID=A0A8H5H500_9AGAR|nr:hypothetical protein D9757_008888 [Collybiopsis confluens]
MSTGPSRPKRRNGTSCDTCKRRKVRCVGATPSNRSCDTCLAAKLACTYAGTFKNRVISKDYIERLESRLSELELLLKQTSVRDTEVPSTILLNSQEPSMDTSVGPGQDGEELRLSDEDFDSVAVIQQGISSLNVTPFHGRSSSSKLVSEVFEWKRQTSQLSASYDKSLSPVRLLKRSEFWSPYPWDSESTTLYNLFTFPERDLLDSLVALYFENVNYMYALLHRPKFEEYIARNYHLQDPQFANVVLLVLAIASRYSLDTRVILEGTESRLSAGWEWFSQVNIYNKQTLSIPTLFNLQAIVLYTIYVQNGPGQEEGWSLISSGLRLAQAIGAHRKKIYSSRLTVTDEQWKRVFWCLYHLDLQFALMLGRPCALHEEDFDLELPIDCDDEYWVTSTSGDFFEQPPDKPSKIAFIRSFLEANVILSYALRTMYSINKSKAFMGYAGQGWEERLVTELESRLNAWAAKIPPHLRFSPNIQDNIFFVQAAILNSVYHDLTILVHHPFVALGGRSSSITSSCLASCDRAAHACSNIASIVSRRAPLVLAPVLLHTAFTSAMILFFNLFSARRTGTSIDVADTIVCVDGCMRVLENAESRSWAAGQHRDILHNLAKLGDLPLVSASTLSVNHSVSAGNQDSPVELPPFSSPARPILTQVPPSTFDDDEQIRNMWNDAPIGMGFE